MATNKVMVMVVVIVKVMMLILTKADDEGHRPNYPIFFTCPDVSPSPCHLSGAKAAVPNERILPPLTPRRPSTHAPRRRNWPLSRGQRPRPFARARPTPACCVLISFITEPYSPRPPAQARVLRSPITSIRPMAHQTCHRSMQNAILETRRGPEICTFPPRNPLRFLGRRHPPLQTSYLSVLRVR